MVCVFPSAESSTLSPFMVARYVTFTLSPSAVVPSFTSLVEEYIFRMELIYSSTSAESTCVTDSPTVYPLYSPNLILPSELFVSVFPFPHAAMENAVQTQSAKAINLFFILLNLFLFSIKTNINSLRFPFILSDLIISYNFIPQI